MKLSSGSTCICGHAAAVHEHYRRGTDCAFCGPSTCSHFRSGGGLVGWARRLVASLTGTDEFAVVKLHLVAG